MAHLTQLIITEKDLLNNSTFQLDICLIILSMQTQMAGVLLISWITKFVDIWQILNSQLQQ